MSNRVKILGYYKGKANRLFLYPDALGEYDYSLLDSWDSWIAYLEHNGEYFPFKEKKRLYVDSVQWDRV